ncbi:MAG: hypothetical protein CVV63_01190, partial [Tenericutes bacterium HGW-Tenericutes-8]
MKKVFTLLLVIFNGLLLSQNVYANTIVSEPQVQLATQLDYLSSGSNTYSQQLNIWEAEGLRSDIVFNETISPSDFSVYTDGRLTSDTHDYDDFNKKDVKDDSKVLTFDELAENPSLTFEILIEEEGLYALNFDYYSLTETINPVYMEILINDDIQYYEASQIIIDTVWTTPNEFGTDRYGNDVMPSANQSYQWLNTYIKDASRIQPEPLLFMFETGLNTVTFNLTDGLVMIGQIYIEPQVSYMTYETYVDSIGEEIVGNTQFLSVEAENPSLKNTVSIRYGTNKEPAVKPFGLMVNRLNIVDGGSYNKSGQTVYYDIDVEQTGWYEITIKALNSKTNSRVFRTLLIDGQTPFVEALNIPFEPSSKWKNVTLQSSEGENFKFYLEQGIHQIGLIASASPFLEIYETIGYVMQSI